MSGRRKGGWWRYPGDRIRVLLVLTAAGLVVAPLILALTYLLPKVELPMKPDDPLKAMAEALQGIEKSLSVTWDLSITVKLDDSQWKEVDKRLREVPPGPGGCGDGPACKIAPIAASVKEIAGNTDRIADDVEKIADKIDETAIGGGNTPNGTGAVADDVKDIAAGMKHMTRPWACDPPECLGAVHFPHDWPEGELIDADGECGKREWKESGSERPMRGELGSIITKLKKQEPSSPVWIVGHANTLGTKDHNVGLSIRRAEFVECRLEKALGARVCFEICSVGERGSADSLRHPDAWYRVVQVFTEKPSWCE